MKRSLLFLYLCAFIPPSRFPALPSALQAWSLLTHTGWPPPVAPLYHTSEPLWLSSMRSSAELESFFAMSNFLLKIYHGFSSVQFSHSVVSDSATPWTAARQASLSITNFWSLLKLMSIESVMPSNHLILCHPLLIPPSIFPSIRVFLSFFFFFFHFFY